MNRVRIRVIPSFWDHDNFKSDLARVILDSGIPGRVLCVALAFQRFGRINQPGLEYKDAVTYKDFNIVSFQLTLKFSNKKCSHQFVSFIFSRINNAFTHVIFDLFDLKLFKTIFPFRSGKRRRVWNTLSVREFSCFHLIQ